MGGGVVDELAQLAVDLARPIPEADIRRVVETSAQAVEKRMRADAEGSAHFRMARHITHEVIGFALAEIGPEKRGGGNLGAIAYFGGRNGGGGTVADPRGALEAEGPAFEQALGDLGEDIL